MKIDVLKTKLKDVCKIEKGKIGITKAIEGKYPLIVTAEERSSHNEWHFDEPATIVPLVSSTGHGHASIKRLHYAEGEYAVGNILAALIPKDHKHLNAKYLYVYLTINKEELLVSQMTGAANVSLTLTRLAEVEIEIPDNETQLRVIKKYEDAERYKSSMNSQIEARSEKLEKLRQQILQDAITGKLSEKWRKENPTVESGEVLLEKIKAEKEKLVKEGASTGSARAKKQKPLPPISESEKPFELPEGWVWCRLGDIADITSSKRIFAKDYTSKGVPFYRSKEIGNLASGNPDDSEYYISLDRYEEIKNKYAVPKKGDLLVTSVGSIGNSWIVDDRSFYFKDGNITHLSSYKDVNIKYIQKFIASKLFYIQIAQNLLGTVYNALTIIKFKKLIFPLPPVAEQHHIISRTESLFSKLDRIKELNIENKTNTDLLNQVVLEEMFEE